MHISALGYHHQSGGALVQPVYHMENEIAPPPVGQRTGHRRRARQKVGGVGGHAGRLVDDHQMGVLIDDRQRPVPRRRQEPWRPQIIGAHRYSVPGVNDVYRPGVSAIDRDAVFGPGEPGDGMGGKMEPGFQNVPDADSILLRRHGIGDALHQGCPR